MTYPSYLIHFNRLHDKKGRFTYGDGDGDGRRNDRASSEGDRSRSYVNSGRRNYEGGGGGRFGTVSGRTRSDKSQKPRHTQTEIDYANNYRKPSGTKKPILGNADPDIGRSPATQHINFTKTNTSSRFYDNGTGKTTSRYSNYGTQKSTMRTPGGGGGGSTDIVAYGGKPSEEDEEEKRKENNN